MWGGGSTFSIKGGEAGFADRERRLLECLNAAEHEKNEREGSCLNPASHQAVMDVELQSRDVQSRKRRRAETKQFRGKESIFKKPGGPPPRFQSRDVPDHHRNPHKWVKYSLGDVSPEDMSDTCNTATALAFLRELELRKEGLAGTDFHSMDCDSCEAAPVVFKRATQKKPRLCAPNEAVKYTESTDKAVFKSSKLVMPEYVVGREKKKEKKVRSTSPGSKYDKSKEIKLHHLQFQEDPE